MNFSLSCDICVACIFKSRFDSFFFDFGYENLHNLAFKLQFLFHLLCKFYKQLNGSFFFVVVTNSILNILDFALVDLLLIKLNSISCKGGKETFDFFFIVIILVLCTCS